MMSKLFFLSWFVFAYSKNLEEEFYEGVEKYQETYYLPKLAYGYNALEPWIDAVTLEEHYAVIFAEYVTKMNSILKEWRASKEQEELSKTSIINILKKSEDIPDKWRIELVNSAGGYISHLFYFATLSPNSKGIERKMSPNLQRIFLSSFRTILRFQTDMSSEVQNHFGNGHIWLCRVPRKNYLTLYATSDELTPLMFDFQPVLVLDVWEHAYFVKNKSNREKYLNNWWKVVDWKKVERIFDWWKSFDPKHEEL